MFRSLLARVGLVAVLAVSVAAPALAVQRQYLLDRDASSVGFTWFLGKDAIKGAMPVDSADIALDFDRLENSRVRVAVDVTGAKAGFLFATQAMMGPKILDAAQYPKIVFQSSRVHRDGPHANVDGELTVRGVTRPVTFRVELYREEGQDPGDLSRVTVLVTGALNRSEFGADGWSDLAGDEVRLRIVARMVREGG